MEWWLYCTFWQIAAILENGCAPSAARTKLKMREAEEIFDDIIKRDNTLVADAWCEKGNCNWNLKHEEKAFEGYLKASELMTKKPTTGDQNMLVGEVLNIMNTKKITNLFICEKNKPIGIIHIHDLLRLSS